MTNNDNFNLTLKNFLTSKTIKTIEDEIIWVMKTQYTRHDESINAKNLLKVRKKIINDFLLKNYQKELLPVIVDFNENLIKHLHKFYCKVANTYDLLLKNNKGDYIQVQGEYFFDDYPKNHPVQNNTRQTFWEALTDSENNNIFSEINFMSSSDRDITPSFNEIIYLGESKDNWNEGLDENLTKDLNLIYPFHDLFDHSNFALTDFIYCQDFIFNISCDMSVSGKK